MEVFKEPIILTVVVANIQPSLFFCLFKFLLTPTAPHLVLIFFNTEYVHVRLHNQLKKQSDNGVIIKV